MSREYRRSLFIVGVLCIAAVVGMVVLWPRGELDTTTGEVAQNTELVDAELVEVITSAVDEELGLAPGTVDVEVLARLENGEEVRFTTTDDTGASYRAGDQVIVAAVSDAGTAPTFYISDFQRERPLLFLVAVFVIVVVAFGRFQGVRALVGLGLSVVVIIGFIVPAILAGSSPVIVAVVGALVIMVVTLYLSHGISPKTTAAVVGTAGALLLTALLAQLFVTATSLTGFTSEEARMAAFEISGLSLDGLLLAGIVVGGLGVLDDVTISQASTVFELRRAAPDARLTQIITGALNVGRDHISATINTLFLAYAGAALPLLILFSLSDQAVTTTLTSEIVAVEIVRTLVGSIGLIAAVPMTTALAAVLARDDPRPADDADEEERAWLQRLGEV